MSEFLKTALKTLNEIYPLDREYKPTIDEDEQMAEIQNLKMTVRYEQFFFVLNLVERRIEQVHGLEEWLGHANSRFTLIDYVNIIHPHEFRKLDISAMSAFKTANSKDVEIRFMEDKLIVQIPLRHQNGKYYLTKRTLYPFQIDESGDVLSYLNHFVILDEFDDLNLLQVRVGKNKKLVETAHSSILKQHHTNSLRKINNSEVSFNDTDLQILRTIAGNPQLQLKDVANKLNRNPVTLQKTDSKRILNKGRQIFNIDEFSNLKELSRYMKKSGFL